MPTPPSMTTELGAFERHKPDLCARFPGQFAILLGASVLAVEESLEAALAVTADRFEQGTLPAGIPVLISEIAEAPRLRVVTELTV
jgi:hypothetical protein